VEARLLEGIKRDLFCKEGFALFARGAARLLAERNRHRRPALERMQHRLTEVDMEIKNIMTAIKSGILTASTKLELEQAEAERDRLLATIARQPRKADNVITLLPGAKERYQALLENLGTVPPQHVAEARAQIRELVGEIRLVPTADGYLEAELAGHYEGLLKLVIGRLIVGYVHHEKLRISLR
jgi:site-specific DNA recombinase